MEKPFWKSKKFVYALSAFIASLIVTLLPLVVDLTPEQVEMLQEMLPMTIGLFLLVILGHSANDFLALWKSRMEYKDIKEALQELIDELPITVSTELAVEPPEFKPPQEVNVGDTVK